MFKGGLKAKIENTGLEGRQPSSPDDWVIIWRYRSWQQEARRFVGRWSGIARAIEAPALPTEFEQARSELLRLGRLVERLHGLYADVDVYRQAIRTLFPYGIDADEVLHHGRCATILEALNAHLEKADLTEAIELRSKLGDISGEKHYHFIVLFATSAETLAEPTCLSVQSRRHGSKLFPRHSGSIASGLVLLA